MINKINKLLTLYQASCIDMLLKLEALQCHLPETINYMLLDIDCAYVCAYVYCMYMCMHMDILLIFDTFDFEHF